MSALYTFLPHLLQYRSFAIDKIPIIGSLSKGPGTPTDESILYTASSTASQPPAYTETVSTVNTDIQELILLHQKQDNPKGNQPSASLEQSLGAIQKKPSQDKTLAATQQVLTRRQLQAQNKEQTVNLTPDMRSFAEALLDYYNQNPPSASI